MIVPVPNQLQAEGECPTVHLGAVAAFYFIEEKDNTPAFYIGQVTTMRTDTGLRLQHPIPLLPPNPKITLKCNWFTGDVSSSLMYSDVGGSTVLHCNILTIVSLLPVGDGKFKLSSHDFDAIKSCMRALTNNGSQPGAQGYIANVDGGDAQGGVASGSASGNAGTGRGAASHQQSTKKRTRNESYATDDLRRPYSNQNKNRRQNMSKDVATSLASSSPAQS
jgi:hypothetical protein